MQLIKEDARLSTLYKNKSIAEQNSFDVAWTLLMSDDFVSLRKCIFQSDDEVERFRQILVNFVLATDIFDKELNERRTKRWMKAFMPSMDDQEEESCINNKHDLKATAIFEHIIQASDVSHTMQHWIVYRKWNQKLFHEMYQAYRAGRMGVDPSTFWYQGEISFFDNYIIPLAKKLKDCHIFGASSDEYHMYAVQNRAEWQARGQEIVQEMLLELDTVSDMYSQSVNTGSFPLLNLDE